MSMTDSERQQINSLIAQISQGDSFALEALARLVSGRMLSVAVSVVKNRGLAEEVVQDSFVKILNNASTFKRNTNGYAWICKIVHNTALNALRREKRFAAENIDDFFNLSGKENVTEQSVAAVAVCQAMSVLNSEEKQVIYQKYFMDFTVRDSAKALNRSKSSVQRLLTSAEAKMKNFLNSGTKQQ